VTDGGGGGGEGGASTAPPFTLRRELARKALHVTSAAVPVAYAAGLVPRAGLRAGLLALLAVALGVEAARARSERVRAHFTRATGPLLRAHEHHRWAGATWLLAAFALAVWLYPAPVAVAATWAVSLGDASAAVVGRWLGRRPLAPRLAKTLEGSAACAVVTFVGALWVARLSLGASVVAGLAAALAEAPERPLDDNVRVVLAVGAGILLWRMAFS
jgi:dolichol kinase